MKKSIFASAIAMMVAFPAFSQGLNKEITIEKEIVPEQRAATRMQVTHNVLAPQITRQNLKFSSAGVNASLSPYIMTLDPAFTGKAVNPSPYRGYAAIGYFPAYNLGASAGYRFIDNDRTFLGAWAQFDGFSYNRTSVTSPEDKTKVSDNALRAGADFARMITDNGKLSVNIDLGYGKSKAEYNTYGAVSTTLGNIKAGWTAGDQRMNYHIDAYGGFLSNSTADKLQYTPGETTFGGSVGAEFCGFALDLEAEFARFSHESHTIADGATRGAVALKPSYTYRTAKTSLKVGLSADISVNSGKKFHVAPDVRLDVRPDDIFGFYISAVGGTKLNSLSSIYNYSHFIAPLYTYENSDIPLDLNAGLIFGPFRGGALEIFGGYAIADEWLLPDYNVMNHYDIKAWHAGARLSYDYRSLLSFKASVEAAPSSGNKIYFMWRDRAKTVVNISADVHPIEPLTISAAWELRSGRRTQAMVGEVLTEDKLGNVSNLSLGAAYRVSQPFTIFLRGENLLNKKWDLLAGLPANGICGLAGVSYKF